MRPLLLCALALAACDDDTIATTARDLAVPDLTMHVTSSCATTCTPSCAPGLTCVSTSTFTFPFGATCLAACVSDADCGTRACVDFLGASPAGRYCIDKNEPTACDIQCDLVGRVSRCDGDNVATEYRGVVCGVQYHHCANGCVEADPDGGDLRQASCR